MARQTDPVEQRYYERLRALTGEQRLHKAFELSAVAWRMAEAAVRNESPGITERELKTRVRERLQRKAR
jgi:hypothetical protein